jgi:hypothetical protein
MAATASRGYAPAEPASNAYVGMLGISLAAMVIGCLLLFLDYKSYPAAKAPAPAAPRVPTREATPSQPADGAPAPGGGAAQNPQ